MMSTDFCRRSQSCVIVAAAVVVVSSFFKTKRVFVQRALTHVVQEAVHPSVDGHASDGVVDEVHLPGQRVSVSITRYEPYYHCICSIVTNVVMGYTYGACIYDAVIYCNTMVLVCIIGVNVQGVQ